MHTANQKGMIMNNIEPAPVPEAIAAQLGKSDWTPAEALQFYAAGQHFDVVAGRTRILDTGAIASNALKHVSIEYAEMKGDVALFEMRTNSFQSRVHPWMMACFGAEIANDVQERNHRFLEEALELAQSCGCTQSEAYQLVDYVYGRAVGEKAQEVGGVMVTLAALCQAQHLDMDQCGETELRRIWTKVDQIRAKQAAKPKHSPLPQAPVKMLQTFDIDSWLNELDKIARIHGGEGSLVEITGRDCWLEYFEDGYSPADAYLEDLRHGD